jgi:hypothetical protein
LTIFTRFIEALVKASSFGDLAGVRTLVNNIQQQGLGMNSDVCLQVDVFSITLFSLLSILVIATHVIHCHQICASFARLELVDDFSDVASHYITVCEFVFLFGAGSLFEQPMFCRCLGLIL